MAVTVNSSNQEVQACVAGLVVRPGEKCRWTIEGATGLWEVYEDGLTCLDLDFSNERGCTSTPEDLILAAADVFVRVRFHDNGSWTILEMPTP